MNTTDCYVHAVVFTSRSHNGEVKARKVDVYFEAVSDDAAFEHGLIG